METKPRYQHDCDCCTYLGQFTSEHHQGASEKYLVDLYYCPQMGMPTIVARRSSDGPDYWSGETRDFPGNLFFVEGEKRAAKLGLSMALKK